MFAGSAYVYNNLVTLYRVLDVHHICLDIKKELYPSYFISPTASSMNNIGVVCRETVEYCSQALNIRTNVLHENYQDQASSYTNIRQTYECWVNIS